MTIQSFIIRNAANLRCRFKTRQRDAKEAKHNVRMEFYRVVQIELKKFVNWAYTKASEETRRELNTLYRPDGDYTIRWIGGPPGWMKDIHARTRPVPNGGSGCTIKDT